MTERKRERGGEKGREATRWEKERQGTARLCATGSRAEKMRAVPTSPSADTAVRSFFSPQASTVLVSTADKQNAGISSLQASVPTLNLMAGRSATSMSNISAKMPLSLSPVRLPKDSHPEWPFEMSVHVRPPTSGPFCMSGIICLQCLLSQRNC